MIVHHAKQSLIKEEYSTCTQGWGKVRAQYRWAYATYTLYTTCAKNQHEKGGWAYNTSWAYNTYSTVHVHVYTCTYRYMYSLCLQVYLFSTHVHTIFSRIRTHFPTGLPQPHTETADNFVPVPLPTTSRAVATTTATVATITEGAGAHDRAPTLPVAGIETETGTENVTKRGRGRGHERKRENERGNESAREKGSVRGREIGASVNVNVSVSVNASGGRETGDGTERKGTAQRTDTQGTYVLYMYMYNHVYVLKS